MDQSPLRSYLDTIRGRRGFIFLAVVVCTLAAALYVVTATKQYTANANLLVTPVPSTETNVLGLGLLRQSNDPSGGLSTASSLIDSAPVAARAASEPEPAGLAAGAAGAGQRGSGREQQHRGDQRDDPERAALPEPRERVRDGGRAGSNRAVVPGT